MDAGFRRIITVEDGVRTGGFGEAVENYLTENHPATSGKIRILAIPDRFVTHGTVAQLKRECAIDQEAIIAAATNQ